MRRRILTAVFGCLLLAGTASADPALPPGFQEQVVIDGLTEPTVVRFSPDGRVFVAEKSGLIKVFDGLSDPTPSTYADLRTNVYDYWDRGLLGMALDPDFPADPTVYVLYTHDAAIGGTAPRWNDSCPTPPGPTTDGCIASGRLSRIDAAGRETVLIEGWCQQFPSHSIGQLQFGRDGALYATGGDGASFGFADYGQAGSPRNPCGDPPGGVGGTQSPPTAEGGAFRSQDLRTPGDPVGLNGTLIRVNPQTGTALPSNPLSGHADPNARRIVAYGLRNSFRFAVRPGTNELWLGDVGYGRYDEVDRIDPLGAVENGGWPCYEGPGRPPGYEQLRMNICESLYAQGPSAVLQPYWSYAHSAKVVPGESCPSGSTALAGVVFYEGGAYPASYDDALFVADNSRDCIWALPKGPNGLPDPARVLTFVAGATNPVDLEIGPGGDLYYVDFGGDRIGDTNQKTPGRIRRVRFFAGNEPPVAVAEATPTSGAAPLLVQFDARDSHDPDGDPLTYAWDLDGDGAYDDSTSATPSRSYPASGPVAVGLRVRDPQGAEGRDVVVISPGNTAPAATLLGPPGSTTWSVGEQIPFSATATDAQDGTLPASAYRWELVVNHCPSNCHTHPIETFAGVSSGSFSAPDHEYPSTLALRLTVTDSGGLQDTETVVLQPETVDLTFRAGAAGIRLTLDDVTARAPFTRTVIAGSAHTVAAPATADVDRVRWKFTSWSDGKPRVHALTAPAPATYTARYRAVSADLALTSRAVRGPGVDLMFALRVRNGGPAAARDAVLRAVLPRQVWLNRVEGASGCSFNPATDRLRCPLGTLSAGAVRVLRVRTWLNSSPRKVVNEARISSPTPDLRPANNSSKLTVRLG